MKITGKNLTTLIYALRLAKIELHTQIQTWGIDETYKGEVKALKKDEQAINKLLARAKEARK